MSWAADFETVNSPDDCRVWAWCVSEVGRSENLHYGTDMPSFIEFCKAHPDTYYFHNAAFDCEFIMNWLLRNGFEHSDTLYTGSFTTLISDSGKFYQMEVCFERKRKRKSVVCTFKDSLKKLPMSVDQVAKSFKLPISKLTIDYDEVRPVGHELTEQEKAYITNDVRIMALALEEQFDQGLDNLTIGSDALGWFKEGIGKEKFRYLFPALDLDTDAMIRKAYRGGITLVGKHQGDVVGEGSVYDVNSMYPWAMVSKPLPVGIPVWFNGRYKTNDEYPLYIQFVTCHCKVKKDHLPTLQIKHSPFYLGTEFITETEGTVDLALTSVDFELLTRQYDVTVFSYNGGFMFQQMTGIFTPYVDYWMHKKETETGGKRQIAKLMLNSLYGKFATNPDVTGKVPFLKPDGSVGYAKGEQDTREPVYTALAAFVTAYAREKLIDTAQAVHDRFLYCDTDSIHVLGHDEVQGIDVHPTKLGAWKHESLFSAGKYVRQKTYMERIVAEGKMVDGEYVMVPCDPYNSIRCAGLPADLRETVTFENFKVGFTAFGKLRPVHVPGGVYLKPSPFTIA